MRDVNVVKHRKILNYLQRYCVNAKNNLEIKSQTDYERGHESGKRSAYNDVLRVLEHMKRNAEFDWNSTHCREE